MDNIASPAGPAATITHHLPLSQRLAFSVGHVANDLVSAFWFTYLLVFLHSVLGFSSSIAGTLMLVGQVADGLATPFIGIECDRNLNWFICKYGKRKCWHLVGTILVLFNAPFIFHKCFGCENAPDHAQAVYYSAFIVMFQFGWAAVQISHLSLIPDLTPLSSERTELNAWRYAFTVFSNILVYVLMYFFLEKNSNANNHTVNVSDAPTFFHVALAIVGIGAIFSFIFHVGVHEKPHVYDDPVDDPTGDSGDQPKHWTCWLKKPQFYQVALLYMGTRLTINLTQVYIPNYLQESLRLRKQSIASVPLTAYTSGFVASLLIKYVIGFFGKKLTFLLGAFLSMIACVLIYIGHGEFYRQYGIFMVASLAGISNSIMLITSLSFTNDLIGKNTHCGAFVFGAMSFIDKVTNGLAVYVIENSKPCRHVPCEVCDYYYRDVLTFVVGGSSAIAVAALVILSFKTIENDDDRPAAVHPAPDERTALLSDFDET